MATWMRERRERKNARQSGRSPILVRRFAGPRSFVGHLGRPVRIAHLTDMHVGRVTPMEIQHRAVDLTNAESPDLVVITGDFVCHSQLYLEALEEVVRRFKAPVVGVLGNHDHWSGAKEVRRALARGGVMVLDNAHTTLELGHERLQLLGLDDAYTGHADAYRALHGMRTDLPTIGLSHIAEEADRLWAHGVPLVFSGHTHAGHVTLARFNELLLGPVAGHKYLHGLYGTRTEPTPMGAVYVGAGIGASVVPFRIGERAQREIGIFELGVGPGESFEEHHAEQAPMTGRKPSKRVRARRAKKLRKKQERAARRYGPLR